ncbi:MAG: DUF2520 domain-containing protein [Crocinitomicaceae bacterium]|nr:DUF2520 domain-containing protein [Crocinitomicaceae bacterium]
MKISIAGSGNVAWHFSEMWRGMGFTISEVWSRNGIAGKELAEKSNALFVGNPGDLDGGVDVIFIAVKDDAIAEVSRKLPPVTTTLHSSGATPVDVLVQPQRGVVWGVRSFRREKKLDYSTIPFCIEASDRNTENLIRSLLPGRQVFTTSSDQRFKAHIALVFGNNFVTQLYSIAEEILHENGLPIEILLPSIRDMAEGMQQYRPDQLQTGPALRGDIQTLERHLVYLKNDTELTDIYTQLSNRILMKYHGKKL